MICYIIGKVLINLNYLANIQMAYTYYIFARPWNDNMMFCHLRKIFLKSWFTSKKTYFNSYETKKCFIILLCKGVLLNIPVNIDHK